MLSEYSMVRSMKFDTWPIKNTTSNGTVLPSSVCINLNASRPFVVCVFAYMMLNACCMAHMCLVVIFHLIWYQNRLQHAHLKVQVNKPTNKLTHNHWHGSHCCGIMCIVHFIYNHKFITTCLKFLFLLVCFDLVFSPSMQSEIQLLYSSFFVTQH